MWRATVQTGDIIVGNAGGLTIGPMETFEELVDVAEQITHLEGKLMRGMLDGNSLASMTNFEQHFLLCQQGKDSSFGFRLD